MPDKNQIKKYIKEQLKKGFTLGQIEQALLQAKYSEDRIRKAVYDFKSEHIYNFKLIEFIKQLNYHWILFFISFIFLGYFLKDFYSYILGYFYFYESEYFPAIGFLIVLFIASWLVDLFSRKKLFWIADLSIIIALALNLFISPLMFFALLLAFFFALIYHMKIKKNNYYAISLTYFVVIVNTMALACFLYFFEAYVVGNLLAPISVYGYLIHFVIYFFIAYGAYVFLTINYLKKVDENFDYDKEFVHKHFPLKLLNFLYNPLKDKAKDLKIGLKHSAFVTVVFAILAFIILFVGSVYIADSLIYYTVRSPQFDRMLEEPISLDNEFNNLEIVQKAMSERKNMLNELPLIKEPFVLEDWVDKRSWFDKHRYTVKGEFIDEITEDIKQRSSTETRLTYASRFLVNSLAVWNNIKQNKENNTPFDDNTTNLDDHIAQLKKDIDEINKRIEQAKKREGAYYIEELFSEEFPEFWEPSLFEKTTNKLIIKSEIVNKMIELYNLDIELREKRHEYSIFTKIDYSYVNNINKKEEKILYLEHIKKNCEDELERIS